jgi:tripartite-type tricarboxylate transporter receptor subunit TctC
VKRREFLIAGGAAAASIALPAHAAYPEKPVHYIIAFAPGGESDIAARLQQEVWRKKWGHELVIESKAGAGGALAWSLLNQLPGDGYSIMGTNLPHIVLQPLEGNVSYKTEDITNVNFFNYTPDAIVVRTESPFKTFQDFVAAAKARPGTLNLAGSGTNSANHAAHARLNDAVKVQTTYVPFKGTGDLIASLLGGHVDGAVSQWSPDGGRPPGGVHQRDGERRVEREPRRGRRDESTFRRLTRAAHRRSRGSTGARARRGGARRCRRPVDGGAQGRYGRDHEARSPTDP